MLLFTVFYFSELEIQHQSLEEGLKIMSFCGPRIEKHTSVDCISVPHQKIQDLQNNGKINCYKRQSLSFAYSTIVYFELSDSKGQCNNKAVNVQPLAIPRSHSKVWRRSIVVSLQLFVVNGASFLMKCIFLGTVCCDWQKLKREEQKHLTVMLNVQASISSPWSALGMALCALFSMWRRISRWSLSSLMAVRGNIQTHAGWKCCSAVCFTQRVVRLTCGFLPVLCSKQFQFTRSASICPFLHLSSHPHPSIHLSV